MTGDDRLAQPPPAPSGLTTDAWTAPFWTAAAQRRLVFARCAGCGRFRMPPTPFCPTCREQAIDWTEPPGDAILYSFTIVERATASAIATALPYVPAIVEYPAADHCRLITNIVGSPIGALAIGRRLALAWHAVADGQILPMFRLAEADANPTFRSFA